MNTGREQSGEGRIVNKVLFYNKYFIVIKMLVLFIQYLAMLTSYIKVDVSFKYRKRKIVLLFLI